MSAQKTIVEEFQEAIGRDSCDGCAAKLGKITDLFFANIHNANDEQVGIFDHLMLPLVERIETRGARSSATGWPRSSIRLCGSSAGSRATTK